MAYVGDDMREHGQNARIPHVYEDAIGKAHDVVRPVPPMDTAAYAKLVVDVELVGGPTELLATGRGC